MLSAALSQRKRLFLVAALASFLLATLLRILSCQIHALAYLQNYIFASGLCGLWVGCQSAALAPPEAGRSDWLWRFVALLLLVVMLSWLGVGKLGFLCDNTTYSIFPTFLRDCVRHELVMLISIFACLSLTAWCLVPVGAELGSRFAGMDAQTTLCLFFGGTALSWLVYDGLLACGGSPIWLLSCLAGLALLLYGRARRQVVLLVIGLVALAVLDLPISLPVSYHNVARPERHGHSFWTADGYVQTFPYWVEGQNCGFFVTINRNVCGVAIKGPSRTYLSPAEDSQLRAIDGLSAEYFKIPFLLERKPTRVLVLAGGSGTEAAAAIQAGAQQVDVVDSRAWLFKLGNDHPARPFRSPRVRQIVCEPRQYLKTSDIRYDLIILGMMEGFESFSPLGLLRTDNYRYSVEAFADVRRLLVRDGRLAVSFVPYTSWYALRLANNLQLVFNGLDAVVRTGSRTYLLVSSPANRALSPELARRLGAAQVGNAEKMMVESRSIQPTTDDWPFLYAVDVGVPHTHLVCLILVLLVGLVHSRNNTELEMIPGERADLSIAGSPLPNQHLPLLIFSCAFSLAGSKCVMTLGLIFGCTWNIAALSMSMLSAVAAFSGLLPKRVPTVVAWTAMLLAFLADYGFNYEALVSISNPLLQGLLSVGLPLIPPFAVACLMAAAIRPSTAPSASMSFLLLGLVLGCMLSVACLITGVSTLDLVGGALCLFAAMLNLRMAGAGKQSVVTR